MLKVKCRSENERGVVVCEELCETGGQMMLCYTETIEGAVDIIRTIESDVGLHVVLPTAHLVSVSAV